MAALDIVSLDTATPQLEVPQSGDTYNAPRAVTIAPVALTGSTATPALDIAQTWSTTGTPTGIRLSVTDTASNAASNLLELRGGAAGTTSLFAVKKDGGVTAKTDVIWNRTNGNSLFYVGTASFYLYGTTTGVVGWESNAFRLDSLTSLAWTSGTAATTPDLFISRDAANTLAQRNSTNAQTFRIYNTFTDASNYERGIISWSHTANRLVIGTEKAGSGTEREIALVSGSGQAIRFFAAGTQRWLIDQSGHLLAGADDTYTIGPASSGGVGGTTTRPRELTVSRAVFAGGPGSSNGFICLRAIGSATQHVYIRCPNLDGVLQLSDYADTGFNRLQFGGTTSSFPALKRDTVRLQARLADDSAFTNIQGKLTADVNAVAETPTATHTITIYDAAGTGYKVLCVAA